MREQRAEKTVTCRNNSRCPKVQTGAESLTFWLTWMMLEARRKAGIFYNEAVYARRPGPERPNEKM